MLEINDSIKVNNFSGYMILQIHDELIFEVPDEELDAFSKMVKEKMEGVIQLQVPLAVDMPCWQKLERMLKLDKLR